MPTHLVSGEYSLPSLQTGTPPSGLTWPFLCAYEGKPLWHLPFLKGQKIELGPHPYLLICLTLIPSLKALFKSMVTLRIWGHNSVHNNLNLF
jgi:hypothetical protein